VDTGDLYGLELDRFVAERNALARRLRADDRRDEATTVAALRKPSVAAHAVNLLAHRGSERFGELFDAGDELRATQDRVLAGRAEGRELSQALERERSAVGDLVDGARELLAGEGHAPGAAVLDRVGETLHAAALDDESRRLVAGGRLERELRHTGLGGGAASAPARGKAATGPRAPKPKPDRGQAARERERAARRDAATKDVTAAKHALATARKEAERTAKALRTAQRRQEQAAEALQRATTDHDRAQRALDEV
jgi:hypothetical protein